MRRYLLYFSYLGDNYCGLQKQANNGNIKTVIGTLEEVLKVLRPANEVKLHISSRTDRGVHALCNTAHLDLQHRNMGQQFDPQVMTTALNHHLRQAGEEIRILKILEVPSTFHARFKAVSREYLYRLCYPRQSDSDIGMSVMEHNRCWCIQKKLDTEKMKEASALLSGTHNFLAFSRQRTIKDEPWRNLTKTVQVELRESRGLLEEYSPECQSPVQHIDLIYKSQSYLFRQVRKMTGVIVAAGLGKLNTSDIKEMLENPYDPNIKITHIFSVPAYGLYLKDVYYYSKDLEYSEEKE